MKLCSCCKKELNESEFYKKRSGLEGFCKICKRIKAARLDLVQKRKLRQKIYRESNREKELIRTTKWRLENKDRVNENQRNWRKSERKKNPAFAIRLNLSSQLAHLSRGRKSKPILDLIGCSASYFKEWIRSQFQPGMAWPNYGEWHIDHITPCAKFDLSDPLQQKICFHFTNLQPLWATDNMRKGARQ